MPCCVGPSACRTRRTSSMSACSALLRAGPAGSAERGRGLPPPFLAAPPAFGFGPALLARLGAAAAASTAGGAAALDGCGADGCFATSVSFVVASARVCSRLLIFLVVSPRASAPGCADGPAAALPFPAGGMPPVVGSASRWRYRHERQEAASVPISCASLTRSSQEFSGGKRAAVVSGCPLPQTDRSDGREQVWITEERWTLGRDHHGKTSGENRWLLLALRRARAPREHAASTGDGAARTSWSSAVPSPRRRCMVRRRPHPSSGWPWQSSRRRQVARGCWQPSAATAESY